MANKWLDNVKDLWDRLTATRAGYIDELDFDLTARLGTPAGASLAADLLTIDNLVDDLETAVGAIEGATTLHNKLTAARAALLDQITAARMAELDAANLPTDVAALNTLLSNATYGLAALETLVDDLETAVGAIEGATTLHNKLTAARATLLDGLTAVRLAELDAANMPADIDTILSAVAGATSSFKEQAEIAVNITAILASETNVFDLSVAATRYIVRDLTLKSADPGANTVTVRLYKLVNAVSTVVATFAIDTSNYTNYFSLMDLFGRPNMAGDNLKVTVQASGGGPYAVTGGYSHAKNTD